MAERLQQLLTRLHRPLDKGALRALSLLLAGYLSIVFLLMPQVIAPHTSVLNHGEASLLMWGVCAGFIHGVGFSPRYWLWQLLFSPWLAWPVMGYGVWLTVTYFS